MRVSKWRGLGLFVFILLNYEKCFELYDVLLGWESLLSCLLCIFMINYFLLEELYMI